jgi:thymidine phosphorylase
LNIAEIIARKRNKDVLTEAEISYFVQALASGQANDAQVGAFAMAVLLNGMQTDEQVAFTYAMRDSGQVLSWDLPGPVLDKHSTGGVGDCTSLILAPALAVCGAYVPMISGRGLGHTGGTLDKLDAIPGFQTALTIDQMQTLTADIGCAMIGATAEIAPADKRLYGVRDVTGTVPSIDLITASILSKKLAAGLDGLVLDVKCGSGAFMENTKDAVSLAQSLVSTANAAGCKTTALITDMNEPLASCAGNAIEVARVLDCLTMADVDSRLYDVSVALGGALLNASGLVRTTSEGDEKLRDAIQSGKAAEKFGQMVAAQGGPADLIERYREILPKAPVTLPVFGLSNGFVNEIDTTELGMTVVGLGGGRAQLGDTLDLSVGLVDLAGIGMLIDEETPIAVVHAASADAAQIAAGKVRNAYQIAPTPIAENPLIIETVTG